MGSWKNQDRPAISQINQVQNWSWELYILIILMYMSLLPCITGKPSVELRGAGASFPDSVYQAWIPSFVALRQDKVSLTMRYEAVGSGSGKRRIKGESLEEELPISYAGSDSILEKKDYENYPGIVMFPSMAGAVVIGYNIPGLEDTITLSMEVLVGIYNGTIKFWNDTLISKLNSNFTLPHREIIVLARRDKSGTTDIFTSALCTVSSWNETYGKFSEYSGWRHGVIKYLGFRNTGISGLILSFDYSIAYLSLAESTQSNIQIAALLNEYGNRVTAQPSAIQAAMDQALAENGGLIVELVKYPHPDAYPIAAYTYLITYKNTSKICDSMLELLRYVDWFLTDDFAQKECERQRMVPLSPSVVDMVRTQVLKKMTCDGKHLWERYQKALRQDRFERQLSWLVPTVVATALVILFIISVVTYFTIKTIKFNKMLELNEWSVDISDIVFYTTYRSDSDGKSRFVMWPSVTSLTDVEEIEDGYQMVDQILQWPGKYMGHTVGLRLFEIKEISKLSKDMKSMFLWMTENILHTNVLNLVGLTEFQESWYCVSDYCSKGPLYNILKDAKYNLTKDFKFSIAMDIVNGLHYLHSKDIIVGCLRSSSCLVDYKWTVKIADWEYVKIYASLRKKMNPLLFIRKDQDEVGKEEAAFFDFWMAPEIIKSSMTELPCRASDIYSYGIILHEVFTRNDPYAEHFDSMTKTDLIKAVVNNQLRPIHRDDTPTVVRQILDYTWSEDPLKRPSTENIQKMLRNAHSYKKSVLDSMIEAVDDYTGALEERLNDASSKLEQCELKLAHVLKRVMPKQFLANDDENASDGQYVERTFSVTCVSIQLSSMPPAGSNLSHYLATVDRYFYEVAQKYNAHTLDFTNGKYAFILGFDLSTHSSADAVMLACDIVWNKEVDICDCLAHKVLCVIHKGPIEVAYTPNFPNCHLKGDLLENSNKLLHESKLNHILISKEVRDSIAPLENKLYKLTPTANTDSQNETILSRTYWLEMVAPVKHETSLFLNPRTERALAKALLDATVQDNVSLSEVIVHTPISKGHDQPSPTEVISDESDIVNIKC